MKRLITVLLLFLSLNSFAQLTARVAGNHLIPVEDSLTKKAVERFDYYMRTNPINYEKYIRDIKEVKMVEQDRYYVGELKNGVIYLNSRLNDFPSTKEVVIIHYLAVNSGMETQRDDGAYVANSAFNITDRNEEMFRRQLVRHNPYKQVVEKLKKEIPLRSKL